MRKLLYAVSIYGVMSTAASAQTVNAAPTANQSQPVKPQTVKKRVCTYAEEDSYSRLGGRKICTTVEVPVDGSDGEKKPAQQPGGLNDFSDRVEAKLRLPTGARPVSAYWRSYFPVEGGKKVQAVFSTTHAPGRQWVSTHPGPFTADGACAIVTIVIDRNSEQVEKAECNGVG